MSHISDGAGLLEDAETSWVTVTRLLYVNGSEKDAGSCLTKGVCYIHNVYFCKHRVMCVNTNLLLCLEQARLIRTGGLYVGLGLRALQWRGRVGEAGMHGDRLLATNKTPSAVAASLH